ncbi:LysM peptidoglycan-binding domain-containing protein [Tuanshanicoccus lijuaniae]|uniref:LysM peptidoglycan-binding domain-containing protein n=1 Tax=Aerococcaceae bacterium zg-1292 TaxID=2774330 RepID=UPI001938C4C0|nr:LysM peptidoglycan-binding domain-containing protein [Aerococcaceae bacterium zg-1292]QQA36321.1 LysM peptidoglycan-binding domain-containing protein [Aerococcaceae bacterium zg-1292]
MNLKNKLILASSVALLALPVTTIFVEAQQTEWKPRTVEQVKADLEKDENDEIKYSIKYGDTLSVIADALEMDVKVLGQVNDIIDLDLIFPGTALTATYNKTNKVAKLVVESPTEEDNETSTVAEVDFEKKEVKLEDKTVGLEDVPAQTTAVRSTSQVQEWVPTATTVAPAALTAPTVPAITHADETTKVAQNVTSQGVEEWVPTTTTQVSTVAPATTTTSQVADPVEPTTTAQQTTVATAPSATDDRTVSDAPLEPVAPTPVTDTTTVAPTTTEPTTTVAEPVEAEPIEAEPVEPVALVAAPTTNPANAGLKPHVAAFKDEVAAAFGISSFSTYRPGDPGDHGKGLAVDFMVPVGSSLGDAVAQYAVNQIGSGKVSYVIWKQKIYGTWNHSWQDMEDRGSVTANHFDHVHVSFFE